MSVRPEVGAVVGGGLEGAERTSRETALWAPSMRSPDGVINSVKPLADARGRDITANNGYAAGAVGLHRDSIVGQTYRLNAAPNWKVLGVSEEWAEEWSEVVEARFQTIAESEYNWLHAARRGTFTDLIRLAVSSFVMTGEVVATSEWIVNDPLRPLRTAVQIISPDRLSNPNDLDDTDTLRRGIEMDLNGRPVAYHI
ncbi:MAG TPA: phage portal protein, partial [Thermomicrobiales bacterium]|nr:phage portal protein [Thermomicrobiales bacterium]